MTVQETSMENGKKVDEAALDDQKLHERLNVDENVETNHGESEYSESVSETKNASETNADNEEGDKLLDEAERMEAKTEDKTTDKKMTGVPIDTGWAWAVLAGCVLYILFWGGVVRSYGVFFLEFQKRFHAKAAEVAIMNIIQNVTISITSLLTMTVVLKKCNCRTVVAIGGILNALSHIISGITHDIRVFYFSHGIFGGAGIAMVGPPMMSTIGIYFKKHRGLANSIYTGSASVGGLILAPVFTTLFEEYRYTGTMIIVAGLLLHSLVSAAFLRPPSWFSKTEKHEVKGTEVKDTIIQNDTKEHMVNVSECHLNKDDDYCESCHEVTKNKVGYNIQICKSDYSEKIMHNENSYRTYQILDRTLRPNGALDELDEIKHKERDVYVSGEDLHGSFISVKTEIDKSDKSLSKTTPTFQSSLKTMIVDLIKLFDFNLLKDVSVILFLAMAFITSAGIILIPVYLAPFAKDAGLSYDDIALMLSLAASIEVVSKISSGIIADRQWIRRSSMLAFAAFATGTACHLSRLCVSKPTILALAIFAACFYGWYGSMYATILIDTIGLEKFQSSLGFVSVIHGLSIGLIFPVSGLLRDVTGSYHLTLNLAGGLCYIGAVFLILLPIVQKRRKRKEDIEKVL